jgi:hypothetical protein
MKKLNELDHELNYLRATVSLQYMVDYDKGILND